MADKEGKQYAVILSLSPATPQRIGTLVPLLTKVLQDLSTETIELLFRSVGADHFGYLIRSRLVAGQIAAAIESPQRGYLGVDTFREPFITNADGLIVLELGSDHNSLRGFARALTWLQRH